MAVGTDERVRVGAVGGWISRILAGPDGLGQIFEVHLVADTGARWHDAEIVECFLTPAQELITFAVALELTLNIELEGFR